MTVIEKHEGEVVRFVSDEQADPLKMDPAGSGEHLTPKGKRKRLIIDKGEQQARFEQMKNARASEILPEESHTPGDNLKIKVKKVQGMDD